MAKALGLIGNFKGKLGNTVGYSLKDSNNKQTQGVRVYQPVVRNPKTAAQAEQRAKLAPINATYRALKMVIDRGQEGKAYGNKSRLAWLSAAMKGFNGGWFEKGAAINMPALVPLTKGSLSFGIMPEEDEVNFLVMLNGITSEDTTTIGKLSTKLIAENVGVQEGDQITFVTIQSISEGMNAIINSIVVDPSSNEAIPSWITVETDDFTVNQNLSNLVACATILSREGNNGAHLRSSSSLVFLTGYAHELLEPAAKQAAIESYMSHGANTDWAEESIM